MVDVVRVIYVDDEAALLELGKAYLEQDGELSVDTFLSAPAALEALTKKTYDVIVSDSMMTEMDGIAFLKQVRSRFYDLPFILFTGPCREEVVIEALNEGADFYLQKGEDPRSQFTELEHKIRKAVARRRAERQLLAASGEVNRRFEEEKIISEFSQVLLNATSADEVLDYFGTMVHGISGADYLMLSKLLPDENAIGVYSFLGFGRLLQQIGVLVNAAPESLKVPVDVISTCKDEYPLAPGLKKLEGGISAISRGYLPESVCTAIEKLLRVKTMYHYELVWEGNLYGGITFGFIQGHEICNPSLLNTLGNLLANGLWRIYSANAVASEKHSLAESEAKFRTIFDNSPYPIAINTAGDGKFIAVNNAFLQSSGYTEPEIIGKTPVELGLLSLADFGRLTSDMVLHGRIDNVPLTLIGKGGRRVLVQYSTIPVRIRDKPATMTVTAEISKLRLVEEELLQKNEDLRVSETKFALVFKSNPVSLTLVSATDGTFVDVNDAFVANTGYTREEVIGRISGELGIFPDPGEYEDLVSRLRNRQNVEGMELQIRKKTGELRLCRFSSGIILMGDRPYILSTVEDITERRNAELAFQTLTAGMVGTTGIESLDRIAESIASWLGPDCIMIGEILPDRKRVKVLSMLLDGKKVADYFYTLDGTPCDNTAEKGFCLYPDNVASLFPESRDLRELSIRGYAGTPLRNSDGRTIGILCILTRNPLTLSPDFRKIFDIIAVKAAAEIERKQKEERLTRINETLLHLGTDHQKNIDSLIRLCGELLDADCILYNKLEGGLLCVTGQWNCPSDLPTRDSPEGHICFDVIRSDRKGPLVVCDLQASQYAKTDPNVAAYGLKTYIGHPVSYGGVTRGSLCAVYTRNYVPTGEDLKIIGILSSAVAQEEEHWENQRALRESEKRLRRFYESGLFGVIFWNIDGTITDANDKFLSILGYTREDLEAGLINGFAITPPEFLHVDEQSIAELTATGVNKVPLEKEYFRKNGTRVPVIQAGVMFDSQRSQCVGFVLDITDQKMTEEALRLANRKLNLLSGITRHDIKNQIMMLSGYLEISQTSLEDPVRTAEIIEKEKKIAGIISHQISFTKDYEDLGVKSPVWQNVPVLVRRAVRGHLMPDIRIDCSIPGLEVFADPLFENVFYNLIDNTLRHGGGNMTTIRIFSRKTGEDLVIIVEDNGAGIAAEDKAHLFDRGFGKNTGLGLFLSREILSITGITVTETGEPGCGARFEMTVPAGQHRIVGNG
jgi:PAS domain S-box-containing protein